MVRFVFLRVMLMLAVCMNLFFTSCSSAQQNSEQEDIVARGSLVEQNRLIIGAERTPEYFPALKGKKVALVANHSSMLEDIHIVDTLISAGISIVKVFTPEHGFRGRADAGESILDEVDRKTALPIISLYGKNKKPADEQLLDVDLLVFDIQDVGARFYTYISTLHYVMEAAAENNIPVFVLDRPNPNGFYVDGPILQGGHQSFVGMHPVPVVHGMTVGEYARMINGEKWLKNGIQCELHVIEMQNYEHKYKYQLSIKPSPNLPNMNSVYLYPSLCFFEGTAISVGRGTDFPFQQIGHPSLSSYPHTFTPVSMPGAKQPKLENAKCYGYFMNTDTVENLLENPRIKLSWLLEFYQSFEDKENFFNNYFDVLAGNRSLRKSIEEGSSAEEIRKSWQKDLISFKIKRKKYLLYKDFE